jgi:hypothetical protein
MGMKRILLMATAIAAGCLPALASAGPAASRFSLTLRVIGPGTVSAVPGTSCVGYLTRVHACTRVYNAGARLRLTALPKVDAKLSSWRGSAVGRASTITVTMTAPKVITATFSQVAPTKPPAPPPPPPPQPVGSRGNPLPLGQPLSIITTGTSGQQRWTIRIVSTQPDATAAVLAENPFNDAPQSGRQFFIANVAIAYQSGPTTLNAGFEATYYLRTVGGLNVVYSTFSNSCGVIPDEIDSDLLPGGSVTGNVCWQVASSDASSLVAFIELGGKPYYMALR